MIPEQIAEQCAAAAKRGIGRWAKSCRKSPTTALLTAFATGFVTGILLRVFERQK